MSETWSCREIPPAFVDHAECLPREGVKLGRLERRAGFFGLHRRDAPVDLGTAVLDAVAIGPELLRRAANQLEKTFVRKVRASEEGP